MDRSAILLTSALALGACSASSIPDASPREASASLDATPEADPFEAPARCTSGERWNPAWAPDEEMFPGRACVRCHAEDNAATGGDAPLFVAAGTVFPSAHEPDDCRASSAEGAVVELTGADGTVLTASVNDWGNFLLERGELRMPYRARVLFQGRARAMVSRQTDGDCNRCHTQSGAEGAPGRVLLP